MFFRINFIPIVKFASLVVIAGLLAGCDSSETKSKPNSSGASNGTVEGVSLDPAREKYQVTETIIEGVSPIAARPASTVFVRTINDLTIKSLAEISDQNDNKYANYVPFLLDLDAGLYRFSGMLKIGSADENSVLFRVRTNRDGERIFWDMRLSSAGELLKQSKNLVHSSNLMVSKDLMQINMVFDVMPNDGKVIFFVFPAIGYDKGFDKAALGNAIVGNFTLQKVSENTK